MLFHKPDANTAFNTALNEAAVVETGDAAIAIMVTAIEPASGDTLQNEIGVMQTTLSDNIRADLGAVMTNGLTSIHDVQVNPAIVQNLLIGSTQ